MLFKQSRPSGNRIGVLGQRISLLPVFLGYLFKFGVDRFLFLWFPLPAAILCPERQRQPGKQQQARQATAFEFHQSRPLNTLRTFRPKPEISYAAPQRNRNWWLLPFSPNVGSIRNVQPEGRFQTSPGAR